MRVYGARENLLYTRSVRPLCRLYFNTGNRYLELFDEQKNGYKVQNESLPDIYKSMFGGDALKAKMADFGF
ncbi:MAG: hypothetical protein J5I98_25045 [Phaeodactylibacter sp.]|nr:hypothetical protein [Phaeodactylibacter sp.]